MIIQEITELLRAKVVSGKEKTGKKILSAFASDLMSDVLTIHAEDMVLITGLCNNQTIRTCEMADVNCIIFARGKKATEEMIRLAEENGMVLIETDYSLYRVAGMMYELGIKPVY